MNFGNAGRFLGKGLDGPGVVLGRDEYGICTGEGVGGVVLGCKEDGSSRDLGGDKFIPDTV